MAGIESAANVRPLMPPNAQATALVNTAFGGQHAGITQFVFVDSSVKAVRITTDLDTLGRLRVRNDGLVINGDY